MASYQQISCAHLPAKGAGCKRTDCSSVFQGESHLPFKLPPLPLELVTYSEQMNVLQRKIKKDPEIKSLPTYTCTFPYLSPPFFTVSQLFVGGILQQPNPVFLILDGKYISSISNPILWTFESSMGVWKCSCFKGTHMFKSGIMKFLPIF